MGNKNLPLKITGLNREANYFTFLLAGNAFLAIFALPNAKVAQLVEHDLAKVGVASSNLVFRSNPFQKKGFIVRRFKYPLGWWNW